MRRRWARVVVIAVAVAVAGLAAAWAVRRLNGETGVLAVTGIVEATQVEVSTKITGRITELRAREGQPVERGQVLVVLDAGELTAELGRAEGSLLAAEAQLRNLEAGTRPEEIREAEARAARAQAQLNDLLAGTRVEEIEQARAAHRTSSIVREWNQRELARAREFFARELIAAQEVERAEHVYDSAAAHELAARERLVMMETRPRQHEIAAAHAELGAARERVRLLRAGVRPQEIEAARARVAEERAALELARVRLGETQLVSPISGIILRKNIETGDVVNPGVSVLTLMDPQELWVRAYGPEADIRRIRLGQEAAISVETYPGRVFAGRVSEIGSEAAFTPGNVEIRTERGNLVFRVKVAIRDPDGMLKPGLPAAVKIRS